MPTMKTVKCCVCGKEYEIELKRYNEYIKTNISFYCSKECISHKGSILLKCANCGKDVWRRKSQYKRSKTGNVYCSRSCAASMNNQLFKAGENHPNYKGSNYRSKAFEAFEHKCCICGYDEVPEILEVHHIDKNRSNNNIDNLCILCPTCHKKITANLFKLSQNFILEPI